MWQEGRGDRLAESGVGRGGLEVQLEGRPGGPVLGGVGWQGSRPGAQIGEPGLGGGALGKGCSSVRGAGGQEVAPWDPQDGHEGPGPLELGEQVRGGAGENIQCTTPGLPVWPHTITTH